MPEANDPALIEYHNVTVCRGQRTALDGLSLSIGMGEHVAILGPNGSGKSTLIKTITRECYPAPRSDSSLRILGRDTWNIWDLRESLGIVSNDLEIVNTKFKSQIGDELIHNHCWSFLLWW